jgi:hypothetical protein
MRRPWWPSARTVLGVLAVNFFHLGSTDLLRHILDKSEMFIKVFCLHREHVFLVAWCVTNVEGNETVMQLLIANRQKSHDNWLRVGGPGHNTNSLAGGESARTAEGDGRGKKILNVRVAAVNDLPNLAFTWKRRWFAHDTNCRLTVLLTQTQPIGFGAVDFCVHDAIFSLNLKRVNPIFMGLVGMPRCGVRLVGTARCAVRNWVQRHAARAEGALIPNAVWLASWRLRREIVSQNKSPSPRSSRRSQT